jgi:hypothetical protein
MSQPLPQLKPLDIVVALALHDLADAPWTYAALAARLRISDSQAHGAVQRATSARLLNSNNRGIRVHNLLEFLEHGIRYAFPVEPGPLARGVPTAASAPPLNTQLHRDSMGELVWPDVDGTIMGQSVAPLSPSVPIIAKAHPSLHQLLALADALRLGGTREHDLATTELRQRLES